MILGQSYNELMSRLQVTDTMRTRILAHLEGAGQAASRSRSVLILRRTLAAAACVAVLLAGASVLPRFTAPAPVPTPSNPVAVLPGFQDVASAGVLADAVGFPVSDLTGLPFLVEQSTYTAYGNTLAQIRCEGGSQWALFRKSPGTEDNSGDYTAYAAQVTYEADGRSITLKGDSRDSYLLAIWSDGTYAFSLKLSTGLSQDQWNTLISANS